MVALVSSPVTTTSVVKVTDSPGDVVVITNPNKHVSDWNIPSVETVSWLAPDGTTVEGVLELPKGYSKTDGPLPMYVAQLLLVKPNCNSRCTVVAFFPRKGGQCLAQTIAVQQDMGTSF